MKITETNSALFISIVAILVSIVSFLQSKSQHSENRADDMGGVWEMSVEIDSSSSKSLIGSVAIWRLNISQIGTSISGTGTKIELNNELLPYLKRTRIEFNNGTLKDNYFNIPYTEYGKIRTTDGLFYGTLKNNEYDGRFSQDAANTKGVIIGKKE